MTSDLNRRLASARKNAGFETATAAAEALGMKKQTYLAHEANRGFKRDTAEKYARRFQVSFQWLLTGKGPRERSTHATDGSDPKTVPVVGFVSAGVAHFVDPDGRLGEVPALEGATESTVAVEVRGTSLGEVFDRWIIYYDDVQRPVSHEHIGRLCVVWLIDGRILVKQVKKARGRNMYHLFSNTEPAILDVEVQAAARVKNMVQL